MLNYFFERRDIDDVNEVITLINNKKRKLRDNDFSNSELEVEQSRNLFNKIKDYSIQINNEDLANAQYVAKLYLDLFSNLTSFFHSIVTRQYKISWNQLQNCFDIAICIGHFVSIEKRYEIPQIVELLKQYEDLYPYKVFSSSEFVISESHCSICGMPMQSLECHHLKGELYWGEMAIEIVDNISTFQAVCLVSHPLDKRCILELADDKRTEEEKFIKLHEFTSLGLPILQMFTIDTKKEIRERKDINVVGRNQLCSCGSGKKFKRCCGQNLYYEHLCCLVTPREHIELIIL